MLRKSENMKRIFVLILFFISASAFVSGIYIPADDGSSVKFKIKNLGFLTEVSIKGLKGTIDFDPVRPATAKFEVTVDANTLNTGIGARDKHLLKEEYFGAEKHPVIKLVATKITASSGENSFTMFCNLRIKNITKSISFPFTATPQENGYQFKGEFKINRRDYGVGGNSMTLSDNLTVFLSVFAKKQ